MAEVEYGQHELIKSARGQQVAGTSHDDNLATSVLVGANRTRLPRWSKRTAPHPCESLISLPCDEDWSAVTGLIKPSFEHVSFATEQGRHPAAATITVTGHREHLDIAAEAMAFLLSGERLMIGVDWSEVRQILGPEDSQVDVRCWVEPGALSEDGARSLGWKQNTTTEAGWGRGGLIVGLVSWPDLDTFDLGVMEVFHNIAFCNVGRNGEVVTTVAAGAEQSAAILFSVRGG